MARLKNKKTKGSSKKVRTTRKAELVFEQTHLLFFGVVLVITALFMLIGSFIHPNNKPFYLSLADRRDLEAKVVSHEAAPQQAFSDVTSKTPNFAAIAYLKSKKILGGYKDGSFRPGNPIDRASFAQALVAAMNVQPSSVTYHDCAKDVRNEWFAPAMCYLKAKNLMKGYADGRLNPASNIKKSEFLKTVVAAFVGAPTKNKPTREFSDVSASHWVLPYLWTAQGNNLLEENPAKDKYNPDSDATRGQVAEVLYRAVKNLGKPTI